MLPPATRTRAIQAWTELSRRLTPDGEEMARRVFAVPVLLRPDVLEFLVAGGHAGDGTGQLLAAAVRHMQERLAVQPKAYLIGYGPVEALWAQVEGGDLSLDQAMLAARALPVTEALTPAYVERLLFELLPMGVKPQTWRAARTRGRLARAAADACDRRADPAFRLGYCRGVVRWAHGLLVAVPDASLLTEADRLGEERLAAMRVRGDPAGISDAEYELAALWTDPYCMGRTSTGFAPEQEAWRQRGFAELVRVDHRDPAAVAMPLARDALTRAMELWRAARDATPDNIPVLAGLAETVTWLDRYGGDADLDEARHAVRHGLRLLAAGPGRPELQARLDRTAAVLDVRMADDARPSPKAVLRLLGDQAGTQILTEIGNLSRTAPEQALAVLERHEDLLLAPGGLDDDAFRLLCEMTALILYRVADPAGSVAPPPGTDFIVFLRQQLSRLGPVPARRAARLVWLAFMSTGADLEEQGLGMLAMLRQDAADFAARWAWLVKGTEAILLTGAGVNAVRAGDQPAALRWYTASLGRYLGLERYEAAADALNRMADVAPGADEPIIVEVTAAVLGVAPQLLKGIGAGVNEQLSRLFRGMLGALTTHGEGNAELLWIMLEFAKGLRTGMVLAGGTPPRVREDAEAAAVLERIARRPAGAAAPRGLQQAFERRRQLLLLDVLPSPELLTLEVAQSVLDHRTVLVSTLTQIGADHSRSRVAGIFWSDGQAFVSTGSLPADTPAGDVLWLPRSAQQVLADLRARGRDHLCVIPDGRLQAGPWHAYGWGDLALADDWIVTLLPHPHLLLRDRDPRAPRQRGATPTPTLPVLAVGIRETPAAPDLPPLPDAPAEAEAIAALLSGRALSDETATEQAVTSLAPAARYLHIASHGHFERDAPSFHVVYLHPGSESDGALCAWEVAELDLRAVRAVTLSACESAGMSVDPGDNVEGLPVAFLTAGARAVIGTQWRIETGVTRHFFEEFYAALALADGDGDLRDAYRAAFVSVRRQFPEPQHWASFYLLGDWR